MQQGTVWVCKPGETSKRIPHALLVGHLDQGWVRGRSVTPKPRMCSHCGVRFTPPTRGVRFCTSSCAGAMRAATTNARFRVDAFDEWSPDMAYALGLLISDGNISTDKRSRSFRIALEMVDEGTVRWFHTFMGNPNPVYIREPSGKPKSIVGKLSGQKQKTYTSYVSNARLGTRLVELGVLPRKSWVDAGVPAVPDEILFDFLRGVLDGDGHITFTRNGATTTFHVGFASNSSRFLSDVKLRLMQCGITAHIYGITLRVNGRHAERLCARLYANPGAPMMLRKYHRWDAYIADRIGRFGGLLVDVGQRHGPSREGFGGSRCRAYIQNPQEKSL